MELISDLKIEFRIFFNDKKEFIIFDCDLQTKQKVRLKYKTKQLMTQNSVSNKIQSSPECYIENSYYLVKFIFGISLMLHSNLGPN